MSKTDKLKTAYTDLKSGKIIEFLSDDKSRNCRCWIGGSSNQNDKRKYIFWNCFGQSANRMSLSELRWIAKVIGKCTTYDYKCVNSIYGN